MRDTPLFHKGEIVQLQKQCFLLKTPDSSLKYRFYWGMTHADFKLKGGDVFDQPKHEL